MEILQALYREVLSLKDWLSGLKSEALHTILISEEDPPSYKQLLHNTLVGIPVDVKAPCQPLTLSQHSHQREVILRAIKRILNREGYGTSVLTMGYGLMSDDENAQVSRTIDVESRYPNNNVNRLHFEVWRILLSRIGDDVMSYILEKLAVFIQIAPTCYLQLTGKPIYSLWPYKTGKALEVSTGKAGRKNKNWNRSYSKCKGKTRKGIRTLSRKGNSIDKETANSTPLEKTEKKQILKIGRINASWTKAQCDKMDELKSFARDYAQKFSERETQSRLELTLVNFSQSETKRRPPPQKRKRIIDEEEEEGFHKRVRTNDEEKVEEEVPWKQKNTMESEIQNLKTEATCHDNLEILQKNREGNSKQRSRKKHADFTGSQKLEETEKLVEVDVHVEEAWKVDGVVGNQKIKGLASRDHERPQNVDTGLQNVDTGLQNVDRTMKLGTVEEGAWKQDNGLGDESQKIGIHMGRPQTVEGTMKVDVHVEESVNMSDQVEGNREENCSVYGTRITKERLTLDNLSDVTQKPGDCIERPQKVDGLVDETQEVDDYVEMPQRMQKRKDSVDDDGSEFKRIRLDVDEEDGIRVVNSERTLNVDKDAGVSFLLNQTQKNLKVTCESTVSHSNNVLTRFSHVKDAVSENPDKPFDMLNIRASKQLNHCESTQNGSKGKKKRKHRRKTSQTAVLTSCHDFRPFDHTRFSQRSRMLFNRNVRERFPKSDILSRLEDSARGAQSLYKAIFVDTDVHNSPLAIEVQVPLLVITNENNVENQSLSVAGTQLSNSNETDKISAGNQKCDSIGAQTHDGVSQAGSQSDSQHLIGSSGTKHVSKTSIANMSQNSEDLHQTMPLQEPKHADHSSFFTSQHTRDKTLVECTQSCSQHSLTNSLEVKLANSSDEVQQSNRFQHVQEKHVYFQLVPGSCLENLCIANKNEYSSDVQDPSVQQWLTHCSGVHGSDVQGSSIQKSNVHIPGVSSALNDVHSSIVHQSEHAGVHVSCDHMTPPGVQNTSDRVSGGKDAPDLHDLSRVEVEVNDSLCVNEYGVDNSFNKINNSIHIPVECVVPDNEIGCNTHVSNQENGLSACVAADGSEKQRGRACIVECRTSQREEKSETEICPGVHAESSLHNKDCSSKEQGTRPTGIFIPAVTQLVPDLRKFLGKFRSVPYKALLNHHCPIKSFTLSRFTRCRGRKQRRGQTRGVLFRRRTFQGQSTGKLLADNVHHRQVQLLLALLAKDQKSLCATTSSVICLVYLFLRAVILRTIPTSLFGSMHNRNVILKNVSQLVSLGKFDRQCLGYLMQGLKPTDVDCLKNVPSNTARIHLLAKFVFWMFDHYLVLILKTFFYITDTSLNRNRLLYYRQGVWNALYTSALSDLVLDKKILRPLNENQAQDWLQSGKALGRSTLRFLPKQKSLRPITNMGTTAMTGQTLSINKQLGSLHQIMSFIKDEDPASVGCGKLGSDEIHRTWRDFVLKWREIGEPKLYFVKTDITNCYDTILQNKMYTITESLIKELEEEMVVMKYAKIYSSCGCLKRTFDSLVCRFSQYYPDFVVFAKDLIKKEGLHDVILVDKVIRQHETEEFLLKVLQSHLFNNIIKVGDRHYVQQVGISQGSVLSTLLCSFYYAKMEAEMFNITEQELLMRVVDDFLYVTPCLQNAKEFLHVMLTGIPGYNCKTNSNKVLTNFSLDTADGRTDLCDIDWFPWCGLLFNTQTLSVAVDYSRYSGISIRDTITHEFVNKPGLAVRNKLLQSVRQKCQGIFMDPAINSTEQIIRNVYLLFLLAAFKFHCLTSQLMRTQRVDRNPDYFVSVVLDLASYVRFQAQKSLSVNNLGEKMEFVLSRDAIKWLCLKAFQVKLHRHQTQYKALLNRLRSCLNASRRHLESENYKMLTQVCGDSVPADFQNILN